MARVAYWPERPLAIVPFTLDGLHIVIPVMVDGHALKAMVDTGADITVMTDEAATKKFAIALGRKTRLWRTQRRPTHS